MRYEVKDGRKGSGTLKKRENKTLKTFYIY